MGTSVISLCGGSHCRAGAGGQTAASPGQGGGGEGGRDGWRRERREGRMGGRWEGREGGRHREEEEQHKGREVRKAQNELHVHVYSVPDMYMYMLCQQCALHMLPVHDQSRTCICLLNKGSKAKSEGRQ